MFGLLNVIIWQQFLVGFITLRDYIEYQEMRIKYANAEFVSFGDSTDIYVSKPEVASWYDYELNGVVWSADHRTAASRVYPRYSMVRVTNLDNNKSVDVYINDYGPEAWTGRDIDLSSYAFNLIADRGLGQGLLKNIKTELIK